MTAGNVRAVTALSQLSRLLDTLRERRWTSALTVRDVSRLLGSKGRVADATVRAAMNEGLLRRKTEGTYELTHAGTRAIQAGATWTPTTTTSRPSIPPSSPGSPCRSSDSRTADSSAERVKVPSVSRRETEGHLNPNNTSSDSKSLVSNKINILRGRAGARTRSKSKAKQRRPRKSKQHLERREKARAVIAATKERGSAPRPSVSLGESLERSKAQALALAYEAQLQVYTSQPFLKYLVGGEVVPGHKRYSQWLQAALQAEELGVSYEFYVKAQFYWFDQWFSRAPKPHELRSSKTEFNAKERVRLYQQQINKGSANPDRKVLSRVRKAPQTPKSVRFVQSERQLSTLMENYDASEEEIFRVFAKGPQASLYFDLEWLRQNETYQRLKKAGEI